MVDYYVIKKESYSLSFCFGFIFSIFLKNDSDSCGVRKNATLRLFSSIRKPPPVGKLIVGTSELLPKMLINDCLPELPKLILVPYCSIMLVSFEPNELTDTCCTPVITVIPKARPRRSSCVCRNWNSESSFLSRVLTNAACSSIKR